MERYDTTESGWMNGHINGQEDDRERALDKSKDIQPEPRPGYHPETDSPLDDRLHAPEECHCWWCDKGPHNCTTEITLRKVCASPSSDYTRQGVFDFLGLPRELRDWVYHYAMDWPDLSKAILQTARLPGRWYSSVEKRPSRDGMFKRSSGIRWSSDDRRWENANDANLLHTPPIMLSNKQINLEALEILRNKPFVMRDLPSHAIYSDSGPQP
ncbi:hypothetical protein LTS18_012006, partial [Coniosporium uncinatum]